MLNDLIRICLNFVSDFVAINNSFTLLKKMTRGVPKFFQTLFIKISNCAYGQHEFFHELVLEKKLVENEKWEFIGEANFKHLYNELTISQAQYIRATDW